MSHRVECCWRPAAQTAVLLWALLAGPAQAQNAARCDDEEFRQLDFWLGEWNVTDPQGRTVGTSTVHSMLDRCAVREEWDSGSVHGISINVFDKPEQVWRQVWVDNRGAVLRLEGRLQGGRMVLTGRRLGSDGKSRLWRVTLSPDAKGTVQQIQERSENEGRTWSVIFEGNYTPVNPPPKKHQPPSMW